jgi:hypothetical protein
MSMLTELDCDVAKADYAIFHDLQSQTITEVRSIVYFTVQDNDSVTLPLITNQQFVVFNTIDNTNNSVVVNTTIDTSASSIGDKLTIIASCTDATNTVNITLPPQMLLSRCGIDALTTGIVLGGADYNTNYTKLLSTVTFDGTQFVCGYDNC